MTTVVSFDKHRLTYQQAQVQHTDIRSSFDDSSAPLLQHDDQENQFSTPSVQFDLEYISKPYSIFSFS